MKGLYLSILSCLVTTSNAYIKGFNLYGLETPLQNTDCSWAHDATWYISKLVGLGFTGIRLPFSQDYVNAGNFKVMDEIFATATYYNMTILLDHHRVHADHQGDWWETNHKDFVAIWSTMIERYGNNSVLSGIGLFNEYRGSDAPFWVTTMKNVIIDLESKYSNLNLTYVVGGTQWGGSLVGIDLEDMPNAANIKYEIHKYIFSNSGNGHTGNPSDWDYSFGPFASKIIIGEFGFISNKPEQIAWFRDFIKYCDKHAYRDTYFWVATPNSGDTGGLFKTCDGDTEWLKLEMLNQLYFWRRLRVEPPPQEL